MPTLDDKTLQSRIESLDLEPIKFKLVREKSYDRTQVEALAKWYKRFLFLTFKYRGQSIVVCEGIDAFWHQHILDTQKYAADCNAVFGEFLHHFPYFGLRGDDDQQALVDAYKQSLSIMQKEFGETPEGDPAISMMHPVAEGASSCSDCDHVWLDGSDGHRNERPRFV